LRRLRAVDEAAKATPYLCARRFTVADISVGFALLLACEIGLDTHFPASVAGYWQRLASREGFQRALQSQSRLSAAQGVPVADLRVTSQPVGDSSILAGR